MTNWKVRILTKIYNGKNEIIKNNTFKNIDIDNETDLNLLITNLKNLFEETWKKLNEISTSIKVPITIKGILNNLNDLKIFPVFAPEFNALVLASIILMSHLC